MPLAVDEDLPTKFPNPDYLTIESSKAGVITLVNASKLGKTALAEANNIFLYEDGHAGLRPGVDWYGSNISTLARTGSPVVTTNLVTNPNFEVATTSWSYFTNSGGTGSIARNTSQFYSGTASLALTCTATVSQDAKYTVTGLSVGETYTAQARIKSPSAGKTIFLDTSITSSSYVSTAAWDLMTNTFVANATSIDIFIGVNNALAAEVYYIDAVQVELNTEPTAFFDGATTDTADTDYAWTGSANASTSTRSVYEMVGAQIDGFDYFDFEGVIHLVAVAGGTVYRSTDNAVTWDVCTGVTMTANVDVNMNQYANYLYLTNSVDDIVRYDGTLALVSYAGLATPAAPTIARTGLAGTNFTVYYKTSRVNQVGFSIASAKVSQAVSLPRESWDDTTNFLTLTLDAPIATQERVDIYYSIDDLNYYYLDSVVSSVAVPNVTYKDNGTAVVIPSTLAPTTSTAEGPKVAELTNVGSRMYGVRDSEHRYRIWFTSGQSPFGAFSNGYDGGYLDWQPGGKYIPTQVRDYRNGKGDPLASVWCDSADGEGCILQMSLDAVTQDSITVTVPSAYKLPGSRGTPAPGSVVNVLNDYHFYNSQAFYNLGSRADMLNLLSTDELSANIRPTVRSISTEAEHKICGIYFDARVLMSVPYGSTENNYTAVYDTERKAWLPTAFTIGFKKFLKFTSTESDGSKVHRLLALKPGDSRLSEIGYTIQGDYGEPFVSSLLTGLYPVSKNRFDFQFTEEGLIELSAPQDSVNVELLGNDRKQGFSIAKSKRFEVTTSSEGWDTFEWDAAEWDDTSVIPDTLTADTDKRYFTVQKELNSVQWHLTTNTLNANYILRTLQTWGTDTEGGHPRQWRI